jgi:UDP-N-acetylmuramoyl-L-alanyl-D-glutamate--2,6-diaminopimelate ligase
MNVVAITGTNGKTTTTYLVEEALAAVGRMPGVMGTVEYRCGKERWAAAHTTPEAPVIQRTARRMLELGATHLVMEASSHGLALGRMTGVEVDVAAFTNLTQDHLDFHGTMEDYARAKLLLFTKALEGRPQARCVVNVDDPFGQNVVRAALRPTLEVSCLADSQAHVHPCEPPRMGIDGIDVRLMTPKGPVELRSPLLGEHNLANLLLALGIGLALGEDAQAFAVGLGAVQGVPGRLERVGRPETPFAVVVDYAHTPDALERALQALRPLTSGRLLCVFGCGGDRDPVKRPMMGAAVARGADLAIVTSDNPRTEEPGSIIDMILPGVEKGGGARLSAGQLGLARRGYFVEPDRRSSIAAAVAAAEPGDTVLIAGKGHEDYQIIGTAKHHFDDREEATVALEKRFGGEHV